MSRRDRFGPPPPITRRDFLAGLAGATGMLITGQLGCGGSSSGGLAVQLPSAQASGIEHIILAMMENRSFDHFLGWLPSADGKQSGLLYSDGNSEHATFPLAPDFQGCKYRDPDHSYRGGRIEYNSGACDGWLMQDVNDVFAIGYYRQGDLPFFGQAASSWTACDRYFAAIMAETTPNRIYQQAAQTDRLDNTTQRSSLPTIWDSLLNAGLSGKYYKSSYSFLSLWGHKYDAIIAPISQFFTDCAMGHLPDVAYVDPHFGNDSSNENDDHPRTNIRIGEAFLNSLYEAVTTSPNWPSTVLVINFDEWGGFFDHVPPPVSPLPDADAALGNDGLLGFRVPCLLISPFARRSFISSTLFDHTSILSMIEWRWGLPPLTVRDQNANNLATALDFTHQNLSVPRFLVSMARYGTCKHP